MFRSWVLAACTVALAHTGFAQDTQGLERRIQALEAKIEQMQKAAPSLELSEVRREIDVLSREIETLKNGQLKAEVQTDPASGRYGLGGAASKVYRSEPGFAVGGYGDMLYQNYDSRQTSTADLLRAVIYTGYKFNPSVLFNSELEVEHASTERGGDVSMEFAYLDYLLRPQANVRAGVVLVPMGFINEQHEPTAYLGARRPTVEDRIIPTTWSEMGAGVFGDAGSISYRAYLLTGLDSARFTAEDGIHEGKQSGAQAKAGDLAVVVRADWHPLEGTMFGGSAYRGNSGQGRGFGGRVSLGEVHVESKFRGLSLRGLVARGSIGDAGAINLANGVEGAQSIGKSFDGWYAEGGYDVASLISRPSISLTPYVRFERFDTQRSVPAGYDRNPENNERILTFGAAFRPIPQTVIKTDWQKITNSAGTGANQFNIALGYIF